MSAMSLEFIIIGLLVLASAILTMSEMAIFSSKKVRLQHLADRGNAKAKKAIELAAAPNDFRSSVHIGITLICIAAGMVSAMAISSLGKLIAVSLQIAPYEHIVAMAILAILIPYPFLVLGNLLPKRLAQSDPERFACMLAGPMLLLSRLTRPFIRLLNVPTDSIFKQSVAQQESAITQEIQSLVEEGKQAGVIHESEREMLKGILRLDKLKISALMTPRTDLIWLDVNITPDELMHKLEEKNHTRYLVCDGSVDEVLGVVNSRDLFLQMLRTGKVDLRSCLFEPQFFPENKIALEVLENFKQSKVHISIILDEYGGVRGMVTMSDILESIVGDLPEIGEQQRWKAQHREDGSWLFDGVTPISEFKRTLMIETLPGESHDSYHTLGGFILHHLEHIPSVSEHFVCEGLRFEVVDMDRNRIDKVLIVKVPSSKPFKLH